MVEIRDVERESEPHARYECEPGYYSYGDAQVKWERDSLSNDENTGHAPKGFKEEESSKSLKGLNANAARE